MKPTQSPMDSITRKKVLSYLFDLVTENKKNKIPSVLSQRTRHLTLVLENVFQPHNFSAVLRSCECFGIQDIHVIENHNDFKIDPEIALGASKWLNTYRYNNQTQNNSNTQHCLENLKQQGYQIAALTLAENSIPLEQLDITQKTALCIGTEETGLTDIAHEMADVNVQIPMVGFTNSFNLSVTAALCMYSLVNKLKNHSPAISWQLPEQEYDELCINWLVKTLPSGKRILDSYLKQLNS